MVLGTSGAFVRVGPEEVAALLGLYVRVGS